MTSEPRSFTRGSSGRKFDPKRFLALHLAMAKPIVRLKLDP